MEYSFFNRWKWVLFWVLWFEVVLWTLPTKKSLLMEQKTTTAWGSHPVVVGNQPLKVWSLVRICSHQHLTRVKNKYAAQFHRLLKEWLFELVDLQIYGSYCLQWEESAKSVIHILYCYFSHNFGTQQKMVQYFKVTKLWSQKVNKVNIS